MKSARLVGVMVLFGILLLGLTGSAASTTYTLKRGDSLWKVAIKFKIPLAALTAANDIPNPDKVREGQKVTVPDQQSARAATAKPISTARAATPASSDGSKLYEVQAGDTLSGLAKRFNTSVSDIVQRNGLESTKALIRIGQELKLPASAEVPPPEAPLCPVRGADKFSFSNSFGAPREGRRVHGGNDLFATRGTPVLASVTGTIRSVNGGRAGIGYYLDGDDGVTYYGAHMNDIRVANGSRVTRGEALGSVGTTGNALGTPPHLHFEVKPGGGASIDPYPLLRVWCR